MAKSCNKVKDVKDFSRVHSSEPTVRLLTIQVIFNQTKYSYNEIREYVKNAIYDLQYFGGADVIESCMIEENFDEACDILRNKRVGI